MHNPALALYIQEQQRMQHQQNTIAIMHNCLIDQIMMSPPQERSSRRGSCNSSVGSEDLVTMHLDMIPPSPPNEKIEPIQLTSHPSRLIAHKSNTNSPPFLSVSSSAASSPTSSHGDLVLGTPINLTTSELPTCEKLGSIKATTPHHHLSVYNNHRTPH